MGVLDCKTAKCAKGARHLEMGDHDHHAEEQRDGVEIDGAERLFEAEGPQRDHRRPAEKGDSHPVETEPGDAAGGHPDIRQQEDHKGGDAGLGHSPRAPATAASWRARAIACSSRVSGIKAKNTTNATAEAAARKRNETE